MLFRRRGSRLRWVITSMRPVSRHFRTRRIRQAVDTYPRTSSPTVTAPGTQPRCLTASSMWSSAHTPHTSTSSQRLEKFVPVRADGDRHPVLVFHRPQQKVTHTVRDAELLQHAAGGPRGLRGAVEKRRTVPSGLRKLQLLQKLPAHVRRQKQRLSGPHTGLVSRLLKRGPHGNPGRANLALRSHVAAPAKTFLDRREVQRLWLLPQQRSVLFAEEVPGVRFPVTEYYRLRQFEAEARGELGFEVAIPVIAGNPRRAARAFQQVPPPPEQLIQLHDAGTVETVAAPRLAPQTSLLARRLRLGVHVARVGLHCVLLLHFVARSPELSEAGR
mmetsp:Transcript_10486/g.25633  ORF Transcript_10486/g.25633 Transcript_10486/m.25633 type:complete len:330 (+) Transcript_10486:213-1202(+)